MKLKIAPQAAADLEAIALYIAAESPRAAQAVVDSIERRLQKLLDYPAHGPAA